MEKYAGLEKIISGGQTGADKAGLVAARMLNITTGGLAPKNYKTEAGSDKDLKDVFGLDQDTVEGYQHRTEENVKSADATVIFAERVSAGSTLTARYCVKLEKPFIVMPLADQLVKFLEENNVKTLNVSGNRESVSPGISVRVIDILKKAIALKY